MFDEAPPSSIAAPEYRVGRTRLAQTALLVCSAGLIWLGLRQLYGLKPLLHVPGGSVLLLWLSEEVPLFLAGAFFVTALRLPLRGRGYAWARSILVGIVPSLLLAHFLLSIEAIDHPGLATGVIGALTNLHFGFDRIPGAQTLDVLSAFVLGVTLACGLRRRGRR